MNLICLIIYSTIFLQFVKKILLFCFFSMSEKSRELVIFILVYLFPRPRKINNTFISTLWFARVSHFILHNLILQNYTKLMFKIHNVWMSENHFLTFPIHPLSIFPWGGQGQIPDKLIIQDMFLLFVTFCFRNNTRIYIIYYIPNQNNGNRNLSSGRLIAVKLRLLFLIGS